MKLYEKIGIIGVCFALFASNMAQREREHKILDNQKIIIQLLKK